jgi:hypothetical protein
MIKVIVSLLMIKVIHDHDYVCCAETLEDFLSPATL